MVLVRSCQKSKKTMYPMLLCGFYFCEFKQLVYVATVM